MRSMYLKSFALLVVVGLSSAMAFGQAAVDTLKSRLVNQSVTVKMEGLRISRGVLFKAVDIRIQDGVIQKRMFNTNSNTDEILNPGDKVRVTKIETATDKKNDYLRITIAAADGPAAPVAFVFPKGALATQDESQLEQVIGTTFDLATAGTPAMQPIAPPPPPPDAETAVPAQPATSWRLVPINQGQEALIAGTVRSGSGSSSAALGISCTIYSGNPDPRSQTAAGTEVRIRRGMFPFDPSVFFCDDPREQKNHAHVVIGDRPAEVTSVCGGPDTPTDPKSIVSMSLDLSEGSMEALAQSPGKTISIQFDLETSPPIQKTVMSLNFVLPNDAGQMGPMMDACFQANQKAMAKYRATVVLSCPAMDGKSLNSALVVTSMGKEFPEDADSPGAWTMPRATKAHPTVQKLFLDCAYGSGPEVRANEVLTHKKLAIPVTAKTCITSGDIEAQNVSADCTK